MTRRRLPVWVRASVSALLLAALVWWIGPAQIVDSFRRIEPLWLVAAIAMAYVTMLVGWLNVFLFTRALLPEVGPGAVARAYLQSWAAGMLAPGKIGDLSYSHFLSSEETNLAPGLAVGVVDKLVTFAAVSVIAVIGLVLYVSGRDALAVGVLVVVALVIAAVALRSETLRRTVRDRLLGRHAERLTGFGTQVSELLYRRRAVLGANIILTFIRMVLQAAALGLGLRAFGAEAGIAELVFVNAIATLVSLIPVTLSGLGARQGVAVILFERIAGIGKAPVLNEALVSTLVIYVTVSFVVGILGLTRRSELRG